MKYIFTLLITLLFAITGCRNNTCYTQLELVDTLTENAFTDSAAHILNNVENTYIIREGKEKAYYNMLRYQLFFRNKQYNISDSLIDYSINYYSKHYDARKLALSYYLKGMIKYKLNNKKEAMKCHTKAERIVQETNYDFLKARVYANMTLINIDYEDYEGSIILAQKAFKYGEKIKDIDVLTNYYLNITYIYSMLNQPDSVRYYAMESIKLIDKVNDNLKQRIYINLAATLENTDTAKAREYVLEAIKIEPTQNAFLILAQLARNNNDYKQSEVYITEALKYSPSIDWEASILYELADTKDKLGKHGEARELSKRIIMLRDSVEKIHARDSIKEIQMASEMESKNKATIDQKDDTIAGIVVLAIVAIVIGCGVMVLIIWMYKKSRAKAENQIRSYRHDIKKKEYEIRRKDKEIRKKESEIKKRDERFEKKVSEKAIARADKIVEKQLEKMKAEAARQRETESASFHKGHDVYMKVIELKDRLCAATDGMSHTATEASGVHKSAIAWDKDMMTAFVAYYRTISATIKELADTHGDDLTEYQLTLLILKDMGLNNKHAATIMNVSHTAIRTQLSRIKKKGIAIANDVETVAD